MFGPTSGLGMNPSMDDMNLLQQAQRHQLVVSNLGEEIDLEIGPGEDEAAFATSSLIREPSAGEHDETKHMVLVSDLPSEDQDTSKGQTSAKRKKKVVKRWREEWADTYKWAYVDMKDGTARIFCSVCREYGRKHRRNPYGNEGSRNMQMSALEEHNNSLLHKEALRLQTASKEKIVVDKPIYVKTLMSKSAGSIVEGALKRDPNEIEFIQSVQECVHALERVIAKNSHYVNIMERLLEPERMIVFRVPWIDDRGETHVNRGFRVQFNQALGPCRGGIRFHPSMNLSIAKFLGFQQTLKNALSPYKLGGASGGSDFDPKGRSDNEIMRFCQSFMNEMYRYMGPDKDLPSEEAGVGTREMGYLFGQYRRLAGQFQGSFTGPRIYWAASSLRTEASGYGVVYFARLMLADMNKEIKGLRCVVSGCGKIAMHVVEKLIACGAHPVTVSDSKGYLVDDDGFDYMKLAFLREIKSQQRSLRDYSKTYARAKYFDEVKPWNERCDVAFPCASQNEVDQADAINLVNAGCRLLVEGSNMPCTAEAVDVFRKANVLIAPAIAAGAGGVAAGEIEVLRESNSMQWSAEDFESSLQEALKQTYEKALKAANDFGYQKESPEALLHGATIAAFLNIAQAMTDQGCV
ncbi:NADP-specific glutamate dehydrogenase [Brassica rapa]|uniref:glutamate dehydrogenase (NADP(+)) n=1 Tax=Brassica campestris TaxID=3711 RepID=M4DQY4_BRACM|nr:NADP-specific glutamate dehydrogenase [Brassica rapa]XP_009147738.1 NADP-specific glutamate dehydrogenase [Brassica rapa]XP_009147739.1 NADP-specific glutamate dehydrogenase [Brassica rapa]XP_013640734.2 NADP-specific glutamate dehydrogenase [Brassica napus]XP_013640735.2 NADP-specific glutamate dehydrogenase [Brassica napus]XP_022542997.2 NADP-specific glutamate dehydrogenase [Brassica napus]XP_033128694.1 NADP-specific glutamate dehydrogenase [Brassica rapa]